MARYSKYILLLGVLVSIAALFVACGNNGTASYSPGTGGTITVSKQNATKVGTTTVNQPRPTVVSGGTPVTVGTSGAVTVQVNAANAAANTTNGTILVTIINQTGKMIHFPSHLTNCSFVLLQHQSGNTWQPVGRCVLVEVIALYSLDTGKSIVVTLRRNSAWPSGTYRATLRYTMTGGGTNTPGYAYSAMFQM